MRPIAVDLFAGAGGLSLGFEQAGFDVVAAVERDPIHAAVHAFNFPRCANLATDISLVTGRAIRDAAGIGTREIDCVFGGPPCQGFSLMGHRVLDDPRNSLVREFVRIIAELAPRTFVLENVKGLTVGRHRAFLDELVVEFRRIGYAVALPWRVLQAADFGVPQDRERLFLLGARGGVSRKRGGSRPIRQCPSPWRGRAASCLWLSVRDGLHRFSCPMIANNAISFHCVFAVAYDVRKSQYCDMHTPAASIIEKFGGAHRVAALLSLNVAQVHRWKYPRERGGTGGFVPTRHQQDLLEKGIALGIDISPGDFFIPVPAKVSVADAAHG